MNNMSKKDLLGGIKRVENIASASKVKRMLMHPFKYIDAIFYREFIYKKTKREKAVIAKTFFDSKMNLLLPSSTDIYLTGGKSHDSEIRLARFLVNYLTHADTFIDVGAHYGYFSLLASKLVGDSGRVIAFEASPTTFATLKKNNSSCKNISCFNLAVSDVESILSFYEFPNLFSEYNSLDIDQYKKMDWYSDNKPDIAKIKSITLDSFISIEKFKPRIIKIDVEGTEFKVIKGLNKHFEENSPYVVMEYLSHKRGNKEHSKAVESLKATGYLSYQIDKYGKLKEVESISDHIESAGLESDNIVLARLNNL